ncbi:hypothetical protein K8942_02230 [Candidatus Peribacteria bacterium]|nr:MAG: hypothetical protein K8942_02230 [Candidatus Peribacteria bacterium]
MSALQSSVRREWLMRVMKRTRELRMLSVPQMRQQTMLCCFLQSLSAQKTPGHN